MTNRVFQKKSNVVARKISGEVILVPVSGDLANMNRIFSLDSVGQFVWERIDGKCSEKDLLRDVTDAFDVDSVQAFKDLMAFMDSLSVAGLVKEVA